MAGNKNSGRKPTGTIRLVFKVHRPIKDMMDDMAQKLGMNRSEFLSQSVVWLYNSSTDIWEIK